MLIRKEYKMKNVANITLHAINNYGSVLQTLATEKIFESLGCEVETIDYVRETAQLDTLLKIVRYGGPGWKIKLKQIVLHLLPNSDSRRAEKLYAFRHKHLHLTKRKYLSDKELEEYTPEADIYCTGSDQTWNTEVQHGVPRAFFLHFAPEGKKRIAFSASFGISELPERDRVEVKELLSHYSAISVREASGKKILDDLGFHDSVQVLDPTLAADPELWFNLASPRIIEQDYILVYQLNSNAAFVKYVNEFARLKGLHVVHVRLRKESIANCTFMPDCSPEDLLSLFKYSSYVITDSFHATVFSLLFHCNFVDIYPSKFPTRIESILKLTGLQSRHVTDFSRYDYTDTPIDYEKVDAIFAAEREKTIDFLKKAIS